MEDLGAGAQRLGEAVVADRHHHEFLEVDRIVRVGAAVEDVHHRHRQDRRVDAADIAVERQVGRDRRGLCDGQRDAEDGVGAEAALVVGAVERDHQLVDVALALGVEAGERVEQLAVDGVDGIADALAAVAVAAVTPLDGFVGAGGRARGNGRPAERSVLEQDVDFDSGVAAAVQNFPGNDVDNGSQG